jgi:hypothetical protein
MAVDVAKITQSRQKDRDEVKKSGSEAAVALELRYIADALEAIRGELAGLVHLTGSMATRPRESL